MKLEVSDIVANAVLLFTIFAVLKLVGGLDWSWGWTTSPLWLGASVAVGLFIGRKVGALIEGLRE